MRLFQENKHEHAKVQMNTNRHMIEADTTTELISTSVFHYSELNQIY